jgi:hypothetical protein
MTNRIMTTILWAVTGGMVFWLPPIVLSAIFRWNVSTLFLNLSALAGLALLGLVARIGDDGRPRWGWVLTGIYISGPAAMLVASSFSRLPSSVASLPGDWLWRIAFCLFPPMTLWMATLNGMIFSVLFVSAVLPFLALRRRES